MAEFRLPPFETAAILVKDAMRLSGKGIFTLQALRDIINAATRPWPYDGRRPASGQIIEKLISEKIIRHLVLKSPAYTDISRYAFDTVSMLELATALRPNAYLSHWSAADILGLSKRPSPTLYVNKEQSAKPSPKGELSQAAIDRAFANRQRRSNYIFTLDAQTFTLLNGKNTKNHGVTTASIDGRNIAFTDLARTLIDIAVRPGYAGGVAHVADIFTAASTKIQLDDLLASLRTLDYKYPYHQSLGYYLSLAGVPRSDLEPFRKLGIRHKFYLDYGASDPVLDEQWQVYVPNDLAH